MHDICRQERRLPGVTIVSVGHRPTLEKLHTRGVTMAWRPGGSRIVKDAAIPAFSEAAVAVVQIALFAKVTPARQFPD